MFANDISSYAVSNYVHYCLFVGQCIQQAAAQLRSKHIQIRHNVSANEYPYYQPKHYTTLAIIHVKENISTKVISVA